MLLCDAKKGNMYKIEEVLAVGVVKSRLQSISLTVGKRLVVKGWSIFNSSVLIEIDGRLVGIRKNIASKIKVKND